MTQSQTNVGCLVVQTAAGRVGKLYQAKIEHHLHKCGIEWTSNRVKSLWNVALLLRNGDMDEARKVLQKNSIAYNKKTLLPKGVEGTVVKHFVNAQRPCALKRAAAVLRYYCTFRLEDASPKQKEKAFTAIAGQSTSDLTPRDLQAQGMVDTFDSCKERGFRINPEPSPIRTSEKHAEHLKAMSYYYSRYKCPKQVRKKPYGYMALSLMTEPWIPWALDDDTPCREMRWHISQDPWSKENPQLYAGRISFLQEQGCKARVVCQPSAWIQLGFMPYHKRLHDIANKLFPKESCVDNQVTGAYAMAKHLATGHTVHCTDLSSATDRFPRDYSLGVLKQLGYYKLADALKEVCEQKFKCAEHPSGWLQYSVGQPMGLYGSFPLFHLSNMLMADSAVRMVKRNGGNPTAFADGSYFKTVGDDIIFSDGTICAQYSATMTKMGVEISTSKSFQGSVGEFAGFIGIRTNKGVAVFRPYKVPDGDLNNTVQFLDAMGSKCANLKPYWQKVYRQFQQTLGSRDVALDPIISSDKVVWRNDNRGDNQVLQSLCNGLYFLLPESLPDLSGSTKINSVPLFLERGCTDLYGYNPRLLKIDEKNHRTEPLREVRKSISRDPLIREVRDLEAGKVETPTRLIPRTPVRREPELNHKDRATELVIPETRGKRLAPKDKPLLDPTESTLNQPLPPLASLETDKSLKVETHQKTPMRKLTPLMEELLQADMESEVEKTDPCWYEL